LIRGNLTLGNLLIFLFTQALKKKLLALRALSSLLDLSADILNSGISQQFVPVSLVSSAASGELLQETYHPYRTKGLSQRLYSQLPNLYRTSLMNFH
jgi:hypothetical protein